MRCTELFETAEQDLQTLRVAQRAAGLFAQWLGDHNEDTPLRDCKPFRERDSRSGVLWLLPATEIGLTDAYLYLGLTQKTPGDDNGGGFVNYSVTGEHRYLEEPERTAKTPVYLVMTLAEDPSDATDIAYKINWSAFTHEYTHVLDYRRGFLRHKENVNKHRFNAKKIVRIQPKAKDDPDFYYNNPTEFNAYYMQGLHTILYQLTMPLHTKADPEQFRHTNLSSFAVFSAHYLMWFDLTWLKHLTPRNRRKFDRRFAKLYMLVRQSWPDLAAIRDIQTQNAEGEARWAEKDAAG